MTKMTPMAPASDRAMALSVKDAPPRSTSATLPRNALAFCSGPPAAVRGTVATTLQCAVRPSVPLQLAPIPGQLMLLFICRLLGKPCALAAAQLGKLMARDTIGAVTTW